jgi:succinylglutamate desuccinylase
MKNFTFAFEQFINSGDLLALTALFEISTPEIKIFSIEQATVTLIDTGILLIEPDDLSLSSKDILISAGIHGNETAPIEMVNQLVSEIVKGTTIVKHRTLFIIGNPVSMNMNKRFEKENLNRLFCGKYKSIAPCFERTRAEKIEQVVKNFYTHDQSGQTTKYHYDLHTAIRASKYEKFAIYPYQGDKPWDQEQLRFLQSSGVNTVLFGHAPSGTFSYFTSENFQAHAFTVELGKVKPFGENDMVNFKVMTDNLRSLIQGESIVMEAFDNQNFNLFEVLGDLTKETNDFTLHIDDDVSNFTDFPVGTLLSQDGKNKYITTQEGECIVFPNAQVTNGQRAGLLVVPTQL